MYVYDVNEIKKNRQFLPYYKLMANPKNRNGINDFIPTKLLYMYNKYDLGAFQRGGGGRICQKIKKELSYFEV